MKAVVITRMGGPEVLQIQDVPAPSPKSGEELVRVQAGGLNFADTMTARGGYPGTPKPPLVAGRESVGPEIMAIGLWGIPSGEHSRRPSQHGRICSGLCRRTGAPKEGAAFPVNFFTAYFAYWKAGLPDHPKGARVLIHAVAGGVGTAAVQIGKLLGVEMYGTSSSEEKIARVQKLGLKHAINYKKQDYEEAIRDITNGEGVDVVFEMLGGEHTTKSVRCLRDFGRVIVYGSASGERGLLDPGILYSKGASVHGLWLTYLSSNADLMKQAWQWLSTRATEGHLRPVIGASFPMEKAAEAYELLCEGKNFGKVVLKI